MTPPQVANLMWAYGTLGRAPGAATWAALERKAVEAVRDMIPQEAANLTWAFAALGRAPGVATWEALKRRAGEAAQ